MSWCENDKNGFIIETNNNLGQINMNSLFGKYIYKYSKDENYSNYLEIGTWNGLGSTKCFVEGLSKRQNQDYKFYSLECNEDKCNFAKSLYVNYKNVNILNDVLLNKIPEDIYDVFPEFLVNEEYKRWNKIDFDNIKNKSLFFERSDIPDYFDVILLDGGASTTWYEYNIIKNKCII